MYAQYEYKCVHKPPTTNTQTLYITLSKKTPYKDPKQKKQIEK